MTEPRTNRLIASRPQSANYGQTIIVDGHEVPTEIHAYCEWLNQREKRHGNWRVVDRDGHRQVEFITERGSADWLADRGFAPKVGRAA